MSLSSPQDGLPVAQRYWAILTIALGITMAVLDGAIANVALPTIARELNASPAESVWIDILYNTFCLKEPVTRDTKKATSLKDAAIKDIDFTVLLPVSNPLTTHHQAS